jgi:hypothetical protein
LVVPETWELLIGTVALASFAVIIVMTLYVVRVTPLAAKVCASATLMEKDEIRRSARLVLMVAAG